jgi:hypothetical protein
MERAVAVATNIKTDAAKGVQTDRDVLRFANELVAAQGNRDNKVMAKALDNFIGAIERAQTSKRKLINDRRKAQKVEAYDFGSVLSDDDLINKYK